MSPITRFEADEARLLLGSRSARYRYILDSAWKCGLSGIAMGLTISAFVIAHKSGVSHLFTLVSLKNICVSSVVSCLFFAFCGLAAAQKELEDLLKQKRWAKDYNSFKH